MKFLMGLLTGIALGAMGAVWYSVQTGRDLRESFEAVRDELDRRDYEALGQRLETGFSQLQSQLEARMAMGREKAAAMAEDAQEAAGDAAEAAGEAAKDASEG
jgi:gas vesicle protein